MNLMKITMNTICTHFHTTGYDEVLWGNIWCIDIEGDIDSVVLTFESDSEENITSTIEAGLEN